jgi:Zn-dependent protease with chaperone function
MPARDEGGAPLLNPFPFAAEAHFRFGFLLLVTLAATLSAGLLVSLAFAGDYGPVEDCLRAVESRAMPTRADLAAIDAIQLRAAIGGLKACFAPAPMGSIQSWPIVLLAVLLVGTAGFLLADRPVKVRRHGLVALPPSLEAPVAGRVGQLASQMGLANRPSLYLMPLRSDTNAFVFGRNGRPALAVTLGLALRAIRAPAAFDVLATHELAHVANRDLTVHLAARSVVRAFLWLVLPLYAILAILEPSAEGTWRGVWSNVGQSASLVLNEVLRVALAALLVLLARNAVIRARERYADLRAALVPHVREGFDAVLAERASRPIWQLPFATSPQSEARRRGLTSSDDLFAPQTATALAFGFALTSGVLIAVLFTNLWFYDRVIDLMARQAWGQFTLLFFGPAAVLSLVFGASLTPIAWRSSYADLLRGRRSRGALKMALGASLGTVLGFFGAVFGGQVLQGAGSDDSTAWWGSDRLLVAAGSLGFLFLVFWGYFAWLARAARAWTPRLVHHPNGDRAVLPLSVLAALPLGLILPPALVACILSAISADMIQATGQPPAALLAMLASGTLGAIAFNPLAPPMLLFVSLLPIAVTVVGAGPRPAGWPLLAGRLAAAPAVVTLTPFRAAAVGLATGAATATALKYGPLAGVVDALSANSAAVLAFVGAFIGLAALAGAAVAPALRFEHGMLAATTAVLGLLAGFMVFMGARAGLATGWTVAYRGFGLAIAGAVLGTALGAAAAHFGRPRGKEGRRAGPSPVMGAPRADASPVALGTAELQPSRGR